MTPEQLRAVRDGLGLTQEQFAQLLGVHGLTVSKWERGVLTPSPYQVALIQSFAKAKEKRPEVTGGALAAILLGAGVAAALFFLLKAAFEDGTAKPSPRSRSGPARSPRSSAGGSKT